MDDLGRSFLSFVRSVSSLEDLKCTGTKGRKHFGASSCVLCRECPYSGASTIADFSVYVLFCHVGMLSCCHVGMLSCCHVGMLSC